MKEYYCLLLNGCFDKDYHYVANGPHSVMKGVLKKELSSLDTIEEDFMCLDDTITIKENSWLVEGSFPVIATLENGIMIDCVSHKEIKYSKNAIEVPGLSYRQKVPANKAMAILLLNLIDEESQKRYCQVQGKVEKLLKEMYNTHLPNAKNKNSVEIVYLNTNYQDTSANYIKAGKMDEYVFDLETFNPLYKENPNSITKYMTYLEEANGSEKDFLTATTEDIVNMHQESIRNYNNYIYCNKNKKFSERISQSLVKRRKLY